MFTFDFEKIKKELEDYLSKADEHHFSNRDEISEEGAAKVLAVIKEVQADIEEQDRYNKQFEE